MSNWIKVSEKLPIAYKTGGWDGKSSDKVLVCDSKRNLYIATFSEGQLDNTKFKDWYDERDYLLDNEVIAWMKLPDLP